MFNGSKTNFCYLLNGAICILKSVDRKIILPRVITLPHFPPLSLESHLNFLLFVEKAILYAKITVSPKKKCFKIRF